MTNGVIEIKNVLIRVKSIQRDGNDVNETEIITRGTFEKIDSGYLLKYNETDETGYDGAHTSLKILNGSKIELLRTGSVSSELTIEEGKKNYCHYGTPYGDLVVGVQGRRVESRLTDVGGQAKASYVMDVNSMLMGDYDLTIDVK